MASSSKDITWSQALCNIADTHTRGRRAVITESLGGVKHGPVALAWSWLDFVVRTAEMRSRMHQAPSPDAPSTPPPQTAAPSATYSPLGARAVQQHKRAPAAGPAPQRFPGRCGTASSRPFLLLASTLAVAALLLLSGAVQAPLLFGSGATMPPYTVFIDAGSTGSRIHTFAVGGQEQRVQSAQVSSAAPSTWKQASHAQGAFSLHPACEPVALQTPLSALADAATGASPPAAWTYLQPLVDHVETKCVTERQQQAETPFHVWATAGMRVLAPAAQSAVYAAVGTALAGHTEFQLTSREKNDDDGDSVGTPCCATIDGESEGFFAWLAVNTLSGSADFSRVHTTADVAAVVRTTMGALDLGGGSTQVVMAAPPKEGRERVQRGAQPRKALVSDTDAPIAALRDVAYVRTVLGAGAVALESRVKHSLTAQRDTGGNVSNPCSFPGYDERVPATADATTITVVGAGNFESCTTLVHAALAELETPPRPLPFTQGGEQPDGPRFVALSLFYHVAHFLAVAMRPTTEADAEQVATRLLSPPPPFAFPNPTPGELAARCAVLCALPWHVVENHLGGVDPNTPPPRLHGRCFDCALVSTLLSASDVGYGFPRDSRAVVFLDKIHNTTVEWTLGAAIATLHPSSLATRNASRRANAVSGVVLLLAAGSAFASAMVKSTSTSDPSQCSAVDD